MTEIHCAITILCIGRIKHDWWHKWSYAIIL